jgi:hypothetical protein
VIFLWEETEKKLNGGKEHSQRTYLHDVFFSQQPLLVFVEIQLTGA